jgi:hypothetical protein
MQDSSPIPPFSDYEPLFANPLPVTFFSGFIVPTMASDPTRLTALASVVYNHWRTRRMECNGNRIMAQLSVSALITNKYGTFIRLG